MHRWSRIATDVHLCAIGWLRGCGLYVWMEVKDVKLEERGRREVKEARVDRRGREREIKGEE